ncbi:MAG: hypothetical protein GEU71_06105 [Actinobacteria bacterium]|jgi:dipeptidyl aminopeptidase/acylaminoacyl peptidase|nr:hypothetical protein [Actinomycetota bacterium]
MATRYLTIALVFLLAACEPVPRVDMPGSPANPSMDTSIAFTMQERGDRMPFIAVMSAGGEVTRLRHGSDPSWSPDGDSLAFACNPGICTMNADGSKVKTLTAPGNGVIDEEPEWGPTGVIAFARSYSGGRRSILVIGEDGGASERVGPGGNSFSPTWSPDGRSIAFIRSLGKLLEAPPGGYQLWTMSSEGDAPLQLTKTGAARPDWSPDGKSIVFDEGAALWVISPNGGAARKLKPATTGRGIEGLGAFPSWSPDGSQIVYMCSTGVFDDNDLCTLSADGTGRTTILDTSANEASPAWQLHPVGPDTKGEHAFSCPDLLPPGRHPRRAMRPTVQDYLDSRRLEGTRGYSYRVTRMTHRVLGGPEAECSRATWRRSFQVEGHFHYVGSPKNPSSSLSYFRVLVGRTRSGWIVWAEPH